MEERQGTTTSATSEKDLEDGSAVMKVGKCSLMGASAGALGGTVLATYRGQPVPFYAFSMAANFGVASMAFFGSEALICKARGGKSDAWGCAGAGGLTGLLMTVPIGGRFKAVVSGVAMAGLGYGSFYANRYAQSYVKEQGQERLRERVAQARGERKEEEANRVEIGFDPMRSRK
ncbi:unnamed protein product [Sphacelaria rigidula]